MEIQNFFLKKDCVEKTVGEGITRKVLAHHENLMVCELHFQEGSVGVLHTHPHEQCTYIISGKFEFEIGGKKVVLQAGDSTYKQPEILHGAVCLQEGSLIDIFTPEREDFLTD
ncbi:cupin domain-containing protein [uncultured Sphaerochaeta sp.]|uniref:cupin domain-containing protein n=1 Tax=uncultured Sphaerochaeta sp. TaxID=886478 RepID=UPI002A0A8426|nr:cupin domain-containing protein [uncultured Sphaerochaeta sp.]